MEARLPAGQGDHRIAHGLDGHGAQGTGDLLAGGQEHIHLPLGGLRVDFRRFINQVVGGVSLGGEDRDDVIAFAVRLGDDTRHVANPVRIRHRGPAKFLYDQSH